jgi:hypothetical protein
MFVLACQTIAAAQGSGFVYVATNQTAGNAVIQFARSSNGSLKKISQVSTGGLGGAGNGVGVLDPLGSQDSLLLSGTGSLLLVVNAGSNQVSSLRAGSAGLALLSTVASGGVFPNSVALNGKLSVCPERAWYAKHQRFPGQLDGGSTANRWLNSKPAGRHRIRSPRYSFQPGWNATSGE